MSAVPKRKYDFDYGYKYDEIIQNQPENKKRVIKKKKGNKLFLEAVKKFLMIAAFFAMGIAIIYNYAVITEKKMEISRIEDEIKYINGKIDMHNVYLESINSTNTIENMAKSYLGMNYPTRKQTVFLNFDYTEDENIEKEEDKSIFDIILSFIK